MAGRVKVATLAGKSAKILMATVLTSDSGKATMKNPTIQIAVDHGPQIGTPKPVGPLKALLIHQFKILGFFNAPSRLNSLRPLYISRIVV